MKKMLIGFVIAAVLAPAAFADVPAPVPAQLKNAAKTCKALKGKSEAEQMAALAGKTFAQAYGTRPNAYGKCVSDQARKLAAKAAKAAQAKAADAAKKNAAATCKAWMAVDEAAQRQALEGKTFAESFGKGANAYGKCVAAQSK